MARAEIPRLQEFFVANPEYFLAVEGRPPGPDTGREEYEAKPPAEWTYDRKHVLAFEDSSGSIVAMADVIANLFSKGVWHLGLYIVATRLHGGGEARAMYEALEAWMKAGGADWSRLGVVVGNVRAERFWNRMGYTEVRQRRGISMGERTNDLRVLVKSLMGRGMDEYLALVTRDLETT
jgi:GNAT superfamily N-acetyltransferase